MDKSHLTDVTRLRSLKFKRKFLILKKIVFQCLEIYFVFTNISLV